MDTIQKLHGNPRVIMSDRAPIFTGNFWTELFSCLGTQLAHSSSYHPQSYGQTEIVNKCLAGSLQGKDPLADVFEEPLIKTRQTSVSSGGY